MIYGLTLIISHVLAVYIHWPYCLSKCPYCDFNSHVRHTFDEEGWLRGILREIEGYSALLSPEESMDPRLREDDNSGRPEINTVFFGGGTPSLMSPKSTAAIIDALYKYFNCADNIEITLEANPNSAEAERFKEFRHAGINRISIGVQSFDPEQLSFLGRKHSADEGIKAIRNAQQYFDRVSFDLIYSLPHQTLKEWEDMLNYALSFGTSHLSLYQLTIEPDTPFEKRYKRQEFDIPLDDASARFYEQTVAQMRAHGLPPYEVSNFAKPGQECRHNLCYWRYDDYIGIGPGAHGRFMHAGQKYHVENNRAPETWQDCYIKSKQVIPPDQQAFERLMMGLRLYQGIPMPNFLSENHLGDLIRENYLENHPTQLIPTLKGILCHGSIVNYLRNHIS